MLPTNSSDGGAGGHGDFQAEFNAIMTERDKSLETLYSEGWKYSVGLSAQDNSLKALKVEPFGTGMTSEAVTASNAVREELRATFTSEVVAVRKDSITESKAAFDSIKKG